MGCVVGQDRRDPKPRVRMGEVVPASQQRIVGSARLWPLLLHGVAELPKRLSQSFPTRAFNSTSKLPSMAPLYSSVFFAMAALISLMPRRTAFSLRTS